MLDMPTEDATVEDAEGRVLDMPTEDATAEDAEGRRLVCRSAISEHRH